MCQHSSHEGMAYIPGGPFVMGTDKEYFRLLETPQRVEKTPGFWLDINPVTNRQFERFIPRHVRSVSSPEDDMPVVDVTWWEAFHYCRSLRKRLPTEKEWEKAARGPDALVYSYGNIFDPSKANVWPTVKMATPVGLYGPNSYGLCDMSGNVIQYTADIHRLDQFAFCVIKGGSWGSCSKASRAYCRGLYDLVLRNSRIGFRCACSCAPTEGNKTP